VAKTIFRTVSNDSGQCSISNQMKSKPRVAARAATSTLLADMTGPMTVSPFFSLSLTLFVNRGGGSMVFEGLDRISLKV